MLQSNTSVLNDVIGDIKPYT